MSFKPARSTRSRSSRYAVQSYISGPSRSTIPHHTSVITPSTPIFRNVRNEISSAWRCCSAPSREMTSNGNITNTGVGDLAYSKSCVIGNEGRLVRPPAPRSDACVISASASDAYSTEGEMADFLFLSVSPAVEAFDGDAVSGVGNAAALGASEAPTPWLSADRCPLRAIFCASAGER